jgi:translation elongation factor EF-G
MEQVPRKGTMLSNEDSNRRCVQVPLPAKSSADALRYRVQEQVACSRMLDAVVEFLPAPTDVPPIKGIDVKTEPKPP